MSVEHGLYLFSVIGIGLTNYSPQDSADDMILVMKFALSLDTAPTVQKAETVELNGSSARRDKNDSSGDCKGKWMPKLLHVQGFQVNSLLVNTSKSLAAALLPESMVVNLS